MGVQPLSLHVFERHEAGELLLPMTCGLLPSQGSLGDLENQKCSISFFIRVLKMILGLVKVLCRSKLLRVISGVSEIAKARPEVCPVIVRFICMLFLRARL